MSPKVRQCPEDRPLWLRGVVNCGPVDEEACLGGRCCSFGKAWGSEDATLDWDPPGSEAAPTEETAAAEETPSEAAPAEGASASDEAPASPDDASE
jgi:hypothetical protein